jgi:16S rRNA (cytosine967-C5)-methyltransferase
LTACLLDAPCSSTGTVRRHPDIPYTKGPEDIVRPGTGAARPCSIMRPGSFVREGSWCFPIARSIPKKAKRMVQGFLADHPAWRIKPVDPARWPGLKAAITEGRSQDTSGHAGQ